MSRATSRRFIALNDVAAVHVSFGEDLEEWEERVTVADAIESRRARAYLELLSSEDREHRKTTGYLEQYTELGNDAWIDPIACPVCGLDALVPPRVRVLPR